MSQQVGQDKHVFMEQLISAASEADIEGMTLEDALCLTVLSGLLDSRLRENLSELKKPIFFASFWCDDRCLFTLKGCC